MLVLHPSLCDIPISHTHLYRQHAFYSFVPDNHICSTVTNLSFCVCSLLVCSSLVQTWLLYCIDVTVYGTSYYSISGSFLVF
jgi:hypothetical protein